MALTSKRARDLDTPHGRHHQVQHHRVCLQPVRRGEGFQSVVAAGGGEVSLFEVATYEIYEADLVINNDYVHGTQPERSVGARRGRTSLRGAARRPPMPASAGMVIAERTGAAAVNDRGGLPRPACSRR